MTCTRCQSNRLRVTRPKRYHYPESGLDHVYLLGGVEISSCPACGLQLITVHQELQLLQVIALGLLGKSTPLTGAEMRYLRKECELTQAALAGVLGVTRETIVERERGRPVDRDREFRLRAVLVELFTNKLRQTDSCFLDPLHLDVLDRLRSSFTRLALDGTTRARKTVQISHDGIWKLTAMDDRIAA
jgi:putative transcriptional regulator